MVLCSKISSTSLVSNHSSPFLQQNLSLLPAMAFIPKLSPSHLILSPSILRNSHISQSNLFHKRITRPSPDFVGSKDDGNTVLSKATTNQVEEKADDESQLVKNKMNVVDLAVRFMRPYIFLGTLLSFLSTTARVCIENPHLVPLLNWSLPLQALLVMSVLLGIDGYIGPMNQISDVEIDRINKPYLPLVSGEISLRQAWSFVICSAIHSITTAFFLNSKMRGYAFALLHCAAATTTLGLPFRLSPSVIFLTIFSTLMGLCIGVMKDLPDLEGDRKCNVRTLATIIGAEKVAFIGFGFLFSAYAGSITAAIFMPRTFRSTVMVPAHMLIGFYASYQAWKLVKANYKKEASKTFYQLLWKLFNIEYLIFPFI